MKQPKIRIFPDTLFELDKFTIESARNNKFFFFFVLNKNSLMKIDEDESPAELDLLTSLIPAYQRTCYALRYPIINISLVLILYNYLDGR